MLTPVLRHCRPVDPVLLLRTARRRMGLDQRAFAAAIDVPRATLASWESGRRRVSASALADALAVADLDLLLVPRLPPSDDAPLRRHLQRSLSQRLRLALGEPLALPAPPMGAPWHELAAASRLGQLVLEPPLAHAMWLPLGQVSPITVSVFHPRKQIARTAHVDIRVRDGDAPRSVLPFNMGMGERVWVRPPAELALPTEHDTALRQADVLLHARAARDNSHRRRPAHRDPDESAEDYRLLRTKSVRNPPDLRDGRGWRLNTSASLAQRLRDEMTG